MKKIIKILGILVIMFSFNIKVLAEEEKDTTSTSEKVEDVVKEEKEEEKAEEKNDDDVKEVDLTLKNVKINGVSVISNDKQEYERIIKDNSVDTVKITYELSDKNAVVSDSKIEESIKEGLNEFKVTVSSKDGSKKNTYTFKITKQSLSTDSSLSKLVVNGVEIELKDDVLKYQSSVSYSVKKIEIEAIPTNEKATVIDFKNNKASFDFFENTKEIKIKVEAEDGEISTYQLTVTKRSETDVTLKSLTIKNQKLDFSSDVTDYEIKVLKNVEKLEIDAKATDSKSQVKITNPKLSIGENEVKIEVSNDGNKNTYTIKVIKLDEDDKTLANLKSLKIENYDIDFVADKYEYELKVDPDVNFLVIDAKSKIDDADVEITGNLDLANGSIIKIKVSYDEEIYNVYKINIIKDGTVVTKPKVSKKACVLVIVFDILSMIVMFILKLKEKGNKNKKEIEKSKREKKNNIINNLDDEIIDII